MDLTIMRLIVLFDYCNGIANVNGRAFLKLNDPE